MCWLTRLIRRFRILIAKEALEEEMEREMRFHLESEREENLRRGMSEEQARRAAAISFGGLERFKERARSERGGRFVDDLGQDMRYGMRALWRHPRLACVAILTVALGIGATTAVFSVVHGIILEPLPYPEAGDLVAVSTVWQRREDKDFMAPPDVADIETLSPSIESLVGYQVLSATLTGFGQAEIIHVTRVSRGLMETFRLPLLHGRDIRPDETGYGGRRIAVISARFWRDRMGSDPEAVGSTIQMAGTDFEVVGVTPEGFAFPHGTEVWIPHLFSSPDGLNRASHTWLTVGRRRAGSRLSTVRDEVRLIGETLASDYPATNARKRFVVESLKGFETGAVQTRLWILMAAVSLLLFIACANVANLLLMRTFSRQHEFATRLSLGGDRRRLARLIQTETGLLTLLGGGLGILIASGGVDIFRRISAGMVPRLTEVGVDGPVLVGTFGIVIAVTALASWSPILFLNRLSPAENLARRSRGTGTPVLSQRLRKGLIALQVALSVILLSGTGLLVRSVRELSTVDLGFTPERIVRFTLATGGNLDEVRIFYRTLEERLAALPGVQRVGSIWGAPLETPHTTAKISLKGREDIQPGEEPLAGIRAISPGYLEMMEIPVLSGRGLSASDDTGEIPVAVVNQTFGEQNFPGRDPIGEQIQILINRSYGSPVWTIVGTVGDIRSEALDEEPLAEIYVPHGHFGPGSMTVTVKAALDPAALLPAIRAEVSAIDPDLPLRSVATVAEVIENEIAPTRFLMFVGGIFAGIALLLSLVGLYGVLANLTVQRRGEIGLRLALGAQRGEVLRSLLWEGCVITFAGLGVGLVLSLWALQALRTLLYQVTPADPGALLPVTGLVVLASLAAILIPAWKASRVDPLISLRNE